METKICIKGGEVFLPRSKTIEKKDVVISGKRIAGIEDDAAPEPGAKVVDAKGKLVTPGLIDFHMHAFRYGHFLGVDTEELSPRSGTTSFVGPFRKLSG
jgi:dihydroorotase